MKVLLVNGSPRPDGNTFVALREVASTLKSAGVESEIFQLGTRPVRGCIACYQCVKRQTGKCVFDDDVCNAIIARLSESDAIIIGAPTYYGQPSGALLAVMQRVFYAGRRHAEGKPAAAVAVCRRGGATAAFQTMNMPFMMLNMPVVTSQYWNIVYGREKGEAALDAEGMQTMRTLARNMAFVLKQLASGTAQQPERELWQPMHFIRKEEE